MKYTHVYFWANFDIKKVINMFEKSHKYMIKNVP
jgi:hypothetical protein